MRQNRMAKRGERRDHLNLQVDLIAEKEVTKLLQMVQAICEHMGLKHIAEDKEVEEFSQKTSVETLAQRLEENTSKTWIRTKNMLPAKPAIRSLTRSDKVLCSKNSCSCLAMESICDWVCVEFSLIKPLVSVPSEALPATQVLFPFLIAITTGINSLSLAFSARRTNTDLIRDGIVRCCAKYRRT